MINDFQSGSSPRPSIPSANIADAATVEFYRVVPRLFTVALAAFYRPASLLFKSSVPTISMTSKVFMLIQRADI